MPTPSLIIHGGAGAVTRKNLSPDAWANYSANLLRIYRSAAALLEKGVSALDAATHAVTLLEDCELFNCGKGAVFTRDGKVELEASVMVTHPYHKRYCAAVLLSRVKNPSKFVREMLIRGDRDGSGNGNAGDDGDPAGGSGGAQGHCCLSGEGAEKLAKEWGLEMVNPECFWTRKRWEEHRKGLGKTTKRRRTTAVAHPPTLLQGDIEGCVPRCEMETADPLVGCCSGDDEGGEGWDGIEYLPQGTVGCVALDREGVICTATSTGGLTNKLDGRIGDTPTVGAGFWAEEWLYYPAPPPTSTSSLPPIVDSIVNGLQSSSVSDCLPFGARPMKYHHTSNEKEPALQLRAIALSGTGNGDSFLRLNACRTTGAIVRFSTSPIRTLASAVNEIAGLGGELQRSAGDRWGKTGEGEAGMIGIELVDDGKGDAKGEVVFDFNCGGMFRCWIDAEGKERTMVFKNKY